MKIPIKYAPIINEILHIQKSHAVTSASAVVNNDRLYGICTCLQKHGRFLFREVALNKSSKYNYIKLITEDCVLNLTF